MEQILALKPATPRREFLLHDVLDANKDRDHWLHPVIKKSGHKWGFEYKSKGKKKAKIVLPFQDMAKMAYADCGNLRDFSRINEFFDLSEAPESRQDKALKHALLALHEDRTYPGGREKAIPLFLKAANAGHLYSRQKLIAAHFFNFHRRAILEISQISEWLESLVESRVGFDETLCRNLWCANGMGDWPNDYYKQMHRRIKESERDGQREMSLGGALLNLETIPKSSLVALRQVVFDFIAYWRWLKPYPDIERERVKPKPRMLSLGGKLSCHVCFDEEYGHIVITGKSELGNVFRHHIDSVDPDSIDEFFAEINECLEVDIVSPGEEHEFLEFAPIKEKTRNETQEYPYEF